MADVERLVGSALKSRHPILAPRNLLVRYLQWDGIADNHVEFLVTV
jgi:hypothetical protein